LKECYLTKFLPDYHALDECGVMFFGMTHLDWNEKFVGFNHAITQTILANAQFLKQPKLPNLLVETGLPRLSHYPVPL